MTYRVVQWATGAMGTAILRTMLDHEGIDVVGTYVYGEKKAGRDIGDLARRDATGVLATTDVDEILALDADVVVHAGRIGPYGAHDDEIVAILESGKNVLSINGYTDPFVHAGERLDRLRAAAERGGVTLMGVGLNPGFIGEQVAVVATGVCARVDHIEVVEMADARLVQDPAYLFGSLGFGADLDSHDPNDTAWGPVSALNGMYEEVLGAMAHHLGMEIDEVVSDHVCHPADSDIRVDAGVVKQGTVGHTNWRWHAIVDGERRLTMSIHWFVETAYLPEQDPPLWRVNITGHPGVKLSMEVEKHPEDRSRMGAEQYAVAAQVINALPHVIAAPPGLMVRPLATPARSDFATYRPA